MKVLLAGGGTGGHLMPALALADALQALRPDIEPVLIGAQRGLEAKLLPKQSRHRFHLLAVEPIHRRAWWRNVRWLWRLRPIMRQCHDILERERPVFVVGTGGYAAGPMLWACRRRGIPIALQEQNAFPGITTRLLARGASQIHLGFPEAERHLRPGSRTDIFTFGNPISPPSPNLPDRAAARSTLGIEPGERVCFVVGGSQGARKINQAVSAALDAGALDDVVVLWSTGPATWDEFSRHEAPPRRQLKPFWDPVSLAYAAADLVVSRAGAQTMSELSAWGLPAILIPLPTAAANHQAQNAEALARAGAAQHLPQALLDSGTLASRVNQLLRAPERLADMSQKASERSHSDSARRIAERLLDLAH